MRTKNDNLQTPKYVYEAIGPFDLDPCAGLETTIGQTNWCDQRGECGLTQQWEGLAFVNPPFSQKEKWIAKTIDHGNAVLLLPERGSAPWFGPLAKAAGSYFVMGKKINFIGGISSNNVGSVLFPFGESARRRLCDCKLPGHLVSVERFTPRCST